jgi:predicted Zn-dependent protease
MNGQKRCRQEPKSPTLKTRAWGTRSFKTQSAGHRPFSADVAPQPFRPAHNPSFYDPNGIPAMKWTDSLTATVAIAALFGATLLAAPAQAATQPADETTSREQKIADAGYSGWQLKWADLDDIGRRNLCAGLDFYSLKSQVAMGRKITQQVLASAKLVQDPVITAYVTKIGQNIVRNSDARVPYHFYVVDSNVVNSFALPGGSVFIYSGLILHAGNEAELAGVMGHESAHIAACHGAKQQTKADLAQIAMIPLSVLIPYSWAGVGIYEGVNAAVPVAFLKFSREDEAQADYLGAEYMYKAGYDPNALISFFEVVEAQELRQPSSPSTLFSDHPGTVSRIAAIQKEIQFILPPRPQYVLDTSEFERVKRRLEIYESGGKLPPSQNGPILERKTQPSTSGTQKNKGNPPVLQRGDSKNPGGL